MGAPLIAAPEWFRLAPISFFLFNDFTFYETAKEFTSVVTDSGTVVAGDGDGGILVLSPSDGTVADNDEAYVRSTNKIATFKAGENLIASARAQFTEAATNAANAFFGLCSAIAANTLVDDGGGMLSNFSGAAIFKVDGSNAWKCISSNGTTQLSNTSTTTAGGTAYQELEIRFDPLDAVYGQISFWVNGVQLIDATSGRPITHRYTHTSAAAMYIGAGVKNGSANQQTFNLDSIRLQGRRVN